MVRYIGLDVHKRVVEACVIDRTGKRLFRASVACTREALTEFGTKRLTKEDCVALEATTNTWAVVDILRPLVGKIVVGNALKTKAIAEAKIKTDKVDAYVLANLLRCEYLPGVWQPDEQTRRLRRLTTRRAALVSDRSRTKNRIHSVLAQAPITPPVRVLFGPVGLAWLKSLPWSDEDRAIIEADLRVMQAIQAEIDGLDKTLAKLAYQEDQVRLLMTLPGFGYAAAQSLLAALGYIDRFKDGDHAASYLGLAPMTRQSAGHCYHGRITKAGRSQTRSMLVLAAQHLDTHPGPLGAFFRRLAKKKNRNVAVVATARKLVTIAVLMLKNNEPYRYALPRPDAEEARVATIGRHGKALEV